MDHLGDLLQPSLGRDDSPATAIYSLRAGFLSAFFGGPLAAAVLALVNAYRLKRLRRDWPIGLLGIALTVGLAWWQVRGGGDAWLNALIGESATFYALRLAGLALFGVVYAVHRTYYRSMAVLGIKPPHGGLLGVILVVVGIAINVPLRIVLSP